MAGSTLGILTGTIGLRRRLFGIYALLALFNVLVWVWALASFWRFPVPLGTALLAYSLGLRHAVDADHIAAIDNVTRKLMQQGERPVSVGLYFSLGHSTVVVLASIFVALAAATFKTQLESMHAIGGVIGTLVSALFLLAIAAVNLTIFFGVLRAFRHVRAGGAYVEEDMDLLLAKGGFLARIFRPLFAMVTPELAHVSARLPVRPGLRHRDRDRPNRHLRRRGVEGSADLVDPGFPCIVHRGNDADRHHRQRPDGGRLWLGLPQTHPQTVPTI